VSAAAPREDVVSDPETDALVRFVGLDEAIVERARRIQARMEQPRPLGEILVELRAISAEDLAQATRRRRAQMTVLDLLREDGHLSDEGLAAYRAAKAQQPPRSDRQALVEGKLVREEVYLKALGAKLNIPYVEPQIGEVSTALLKKFPFAYLIKHQVLPVREEDGELIVIFGIPEDDALVAEVERSYSTRVRRQSATQARIQEALKTLQRLSGSKGAESLKIQYREIDKSQEQGEDTGHEAIQLVDYLLTRAVQLGASDLHVEPSLSRVRVRVRIDGVLHQLTDVPVDFAPRVVARFKILSRMDVTEKRLHQDGKIHVRIDGKEIDIRVSTYVSMFGETIVMRLLDRDRGILPVDQVGFQPRAFQTLTDVVLKASSGLVLMVGPTGSGKTTTLYSFIDHANDPTEKVITCEEPVEYIIDGITQCSVNSKIGPTFEESLRAIVRQDPDTIVVGEIRDTTTANLAIEAALTGHKVYSTFHTEEAVGAFVRLLEMGVEPFLVGSTISAVVAQRLVRRLCPECRIPTRPTAPQMRFLKLGREDLEGVKFLGPGACQACANTGYRGRIAIHEVLVPSDALRDAVLAQSSSMELRRLARDLPEFLTMQEDGVLKAASGITSLEEIIENAPRDPDARPLARVREIANLGRKS